MRNLKNGVLLLLLILAFLNSCRKEEPNFELTKFSPASDMSDKYWIQVVKDSIKNSIFNELTLKAGIPQWNFAYVVH
jgi:hypothetical protein